MGFETNLGNNAKGKKQKVQRPKICLKYKYKEVKFVNIVKTTLGVFENSYVDFLEMLKVLEFDRTCRHCTFKKILAIAIRTSYYLSCRSGTGTIHNSWHGKNFFFLCICRLLWFKWPIINYLFREVYSFVLANIPGNEG